MIHRLEVLGVRWWLPKYPRAPHTTSIISGILLYNVPPPHCDLMSLGYDVLYWLLRHIVVWELDYGVLYCAGGGRVGGRLIVIMTPSTN